MMILMGVFISVIYTRGDFSSRCCSPILCMNYEIIIRISGDINNSGSRFVNCSRWWKEEGNKKCEIILNAR